MLGREDFSRFLLQGQNVFVVQLPADFVGADFPFNFLLDGVETAFQAPDPQAGRACRARQAFGAQHQQGDEADEQQFREADTKQ